MQPVIASTFTVEFTITSFNSNLGGKCKEKRVKATKTDCGETFLFKEIGHRNPPPPKKKKNVIFKDISNSKHPSASLYDI